MVIRVGPCCRESAGALPCGYMICSVSVKVSPPKVGISGPGNRHFSRPAGAGLALGIALDFWYIPDTEHLLELIRKLQAPGVLILDARDRPCYVNPGAVAMLPGLMEQDSEGKTAHRVPEEILRLSTLTRGAAKANGAAKPEQLESEGSILMEKAGQVLSVRAFAVGGLGRATQGGYVLVLVNAWWKSTPMTSRE